MQQAGNSPLCALQVQGCVLAHARANHGLAGSCFWLLSASTYPDYDGYKVHLQRATRACTVPASPAQATGRRDGISGKGRAEQEVDAARASIGPVPSGTSLPAPDMCGVAGNTSGNRGGNAEQADIGEPARPDTAAETDLAEPSGRSGMQQQRVSIATQEACEAACGMFESSMQQSSEEAWRQDEVIARLIVEHAHAMQALNGPEVGRHRGCTPM